MPTVAAGGLDEGIAAAASQRSNGNPLLRFSINIFNLDFRNAVTLSRESTIRRKWKRTRIFVDLIERTP